MRDHHAPWLSEPLRQARKLLAKPGGRCLLFSQLPPSELDRLAMWLGCQDVCGHCTSCCRLGASASTQHRKFDVPLACGHIGVDEVREIEDWMRTYPVEGLYKVLIISDAASLRHAAVNACLKLLEELPSYAVVLMATDHLLMLPKTLVSRAIQIRCPPPNLKEQFDYLKEHHQACSEEEIVAAMVVSSGHFARAAAYLTDQAEGVIEVYQHLMRQDRHDSVTDAMDFPKGWGLGVVRAVMFMMRHEKSVEALDFYQELLALHQDLQQGVSLREQSLYTHVLQKWYSRVPVTRLQSLREGVFC